MANELKPVTDKALSLALEIADLPPEARAKLSPEMVAKADEIAAIWKDLTHDA